MSVGNFMDTNKKSSNLLELFSGVRGLVIGAAALLAKNPDPGGAGKMYKKQKQKPFGFCLRCVRDIRPLYKAFPQ